MKIIILFLCLSLACQAEDWTVEGKTFHNVAVGKVEADRVHITYDGGLGAVELADLSPNLQKRFGYNATKAETAMEQRAAAYAASDKMVAQATTQQYLKRQKEEDSEPKANSAEKASQAAELQARIYALEDDIRHRQSEMSHSGGRGGDGSYEDAIVEDQRELAVLRGHPGP